MRNRRRSECLILCECRYWRPVRRPHPFSALVDSRISAIRLFNSCSVISLSTLYDPGDRIDSVPRPSLFCMIFPFGLLTALVQWYQLFHGNSPPLFSAVDIRPKAHGIHPNSLYSQATSSSSATLPSCLEPLSITFPHMAEDRTVRRVTPYIFLAEVYPHLMLDEKLISQISVRIQEYEITIEQR